MIRDRAFMRIASHREASGVSNMGWDGGNSSVSGLRVLKL